MSTSGGAVHSALSCQDVLLEIFGQLSPGWFSWDLSDGHRFLQDKEKDIKSRRFLQKTLLYCALTCRAFSNLALAELWRVLDYHVFLLKLLPWTASDDGLFEEVIHLEPNIDDGAWSRFRWYARLVREMKTPVHTDVPFSIHRDTWALLVSRLHGEPLFPCLRRLQMPADTEDIVPFLFCLSPTIRTLTFEFACGEIVRAQTRDFLFPFLRLISDPSGDALDPSICWFIADEGDPEELVQHFRKSTRLRMLEDLDLSISVYGVDHTSVAALSRIPSMRTLNVRLAVRGPSDIPLLNFSDFANLHHLSLYLHCFSTFSDILTTRSLRTSQLRSVSLECSVRVPYIKQLQPLPIADFQHQLGKIRAGLPDTLEALQFWLTYSTRAEPPLPLATLFAPFLTLNRLKSFDLSFRSGYVPHVLDEDLRIFAAAWPSLEVLSVFVRGLGSPMFSSACPPTLVGLVELAKGCPRLRRVTLPAADVSVLPTTSAFPSDGHKGLRFLDLSALVEDDLGEVVVEDVAKILDKVFPCLQEYSRVGEGMPHAESWHEVQGVMRKMQAARNGVGTWGSE